MDKLQHEFERAPTLRAAEGLGLMARILRDVTGEERAWMLEASARVFPCDFGRSAVVLDERPRPSHDGGHVSGILARVVDLLSQCSGAAERVRVLAGAAGFHDLDVECSVPRD